MPIVSEKAADNLAASPVRHVRLFRNGSNQAVRIPKEFELPTQDATIRQVGNTLVIEPVAPIFAKGSAAALLDALERMQQLGPCTDVFPDVDEGVLPLDNIHL